MRARARWMVVGMLAAATPLLAQQGPGARGPQGRGAGPAAPGVERNIDRALARAEALGLDEARIQELRAMREELAQVREGLDREAASFRDEARQRDRELRESRREQAQALRQQRQEALRPFQERFESTLTEAQRNQLRDWARQDGARRGRAGMARGRPGMQRGGAAARAPRAGARQQRAAFRDGAPAAARTRVPRNRVPGAGERPFPPRPGAARPMAPGGPA